jgi:ABC-type sugar transport system permease subunit
VAGAGSARFRRLSGDDRRHRALGLGTSWFYALLAGQLIGGRVLSLPTSLFGVPFWTIAWFDLVTGYVAAMGLALLAVRRRKLFGLSRQVLLMPLYWLLISVAAYRAVWQFATAPFKWEKTEHGRSRGRANPSPE